MNGVNKYSFAEVDAVEKITPVSTNVDSKRFKLIIEKGIKRLVDIVGGLIGTIILIPLSIFIYIARKILNEDDGPMFYEQLRIGKNGKQFRMYKYRSMVMGADEKLFEYLEQNEEAREEYTKYKKLKNDPRITKIGNFLRKTSLDEFPQFLNVLMGHMSLVGPRPYLPREKKDMGEYYTYSIESKPGITGYWQVAGRNDVTFEDRLRMDYEYNKKKSLKTDLKLLAKTFLKVVKKEGAI